MRALSARFAVVLAVLATGCSKPPLDNEAAFRLIASRTPAEITATFPSELSYADASVVGALNSLVQAGYISCRSGDYCQPAQRSIRGGSGQPFEYVVGVYRLTDLLTLRMTSENTALAQARFELEPTPFYKEQRDLLLRMTPSLSQLEDNRVEPVHFQRTENGWRIE